MADYTITTAQRAPILDGEGHPIGTPAQLHGASSSDEGVASIMWIDWCPWVVGQSVGEATIQGFRVADGAVTTFTVAVTNPAPLPPFVITLGAAVPK